MPFKGLRRRRALVAFICLATLWPIFAWVAASVLIVRAPLETSDAIVVLSGSAVYDERARYAAELYRSGVGRRIILTNDDVRGPWSQTQQRNPYSHERAFDLLIAEGIRPDVIIVLKQPVSGTHDEALLLRSYVNEQGLRSIVLVTSAYHSRRAFLTFRKAFQGQRVNIGMEPVPTGRQTPRESLWWMYFRGWQSVLPEYPKIIYYWLRY